MDQVKKHRVKSKNIENPHSIRPSFLTLLLLTFLFHQQQEDGVTAAAILCWAANRWMHRAADTCTFRLRVRPSWVICDLVGNKFIDEYI